MKRYIKSSESRTLVKHIRDGFEKANCTGVKVGKLSKDHCEVSLVLPNGAATTVTVWFNSDTIAVGDVRSVNDVTKQIDPSWTFSKTGDVIDSNGNIIGKVNSVELTSTHDYQRKRRDYDLDSIRTDSGDVIIDHPEKMSSYVDVVDSLMSRIITRRS